MKQKRKADDTARRMERRTNQENGQILPYWDGRPARLLYWPAWRRLEAARKKAAPFASDAGAMVAPGMGDWRMHRERMTKDTGAGRMADGSGNYYAYGTGAFGDYLGNVPDVMKRADVYRWHDYATGYYTDADCFGVLSGGVEKVRCPRGTLYVPVTSHSDWDNASYWFADAVLVPKGAGESEHSDAMREAARAADSKAEREAEREREHNDAWQAGVHCVRG